jgi:cell division septal protein FtsQ
MTRRGAKPRRSAAHARQKGPKLRQTVRRAFPARSRLVAAVVTAALVAGLLALINGPWLRVARVAWAGERYTPASQLQDVLAHLDGTALLTVDAATITARLERLPAVSNARVEALLPDAVKVTIVEKVATFVWQTSAVRLLGAADGTLIGQLALGAALPKDLATLPLIDDRRGNSRDIIVGDRIDTATLSAALRLAGINPAALGSTTPDLQVRVTDDDGFLLVSRRPSWMADFGFYSPLDSGGLGTLNARVNAQVAAVRTLFSARSEGAISWVDARDPGKVYWRP